MSEKTEYPYPDKCPSKWRMSEVCFECVGNYPDIVCPSSKEFEQGIIDKGVNKVIIDKEDADV